MGALLKCELAYPHQPYIEELHDFFAAQGLPYGAPMNLVHLVDRLDDPGLFHEDMRIIVRSILARQPIRIPRSDVLAMLAVAIGGPLIYRSAEQFRHPLSRLLYFVDGVLDNSSRRAHTATHGKLIPFPVATVVKPEPEEPSVPSSGARVWLTSIPRSAVRSLRPLTRTSPSFRNAMLVAGAAILVTALLILLLRPSPAPPSSSDRVLRGYSAPKPSAYGEAFVPDFTPFVQYGESGPAGFASVPDHSTPDLDSAVAAAEPELPALMSSNSAEPDIPIIAPEPQATLSLELQRPTPPSPLSMNLSPEFSSSAAQADPAAEPTGVEPASQPNATADNQPPTGF